MAKANKFIAIYDGKDRVIKDGFKPYVFGWSMSERNAQKMASSSRTAFTSYYMKRTLLAIVPAVMS